jgi:hypothetical protein
MSLQMVFVIFCTLRTLSTTKDVLVYPLAALRVLMIYRFEFPIPNLVLSLAQHSSSLYQTTHSEDLPT